MLLRKEEIEWRESEGKAGARAPQQIGLDRLCGSDSNSRISHSSLSSPPVWTLPALSFPLEIYARLRNGTTSIASESQDWYVSVSDLTVTTELTVDRPKASTAILTVR